MRLQILELPVQHIGDTMHTPFILVASETQMSRSAIEAGLNTDFRDQTGASAIFITPETVEIGPPPFETPSIDIETAMRAYT